MFFTRELPGHYTGWFGYLLELFCLVLFTLQAKRLTPEEAYHYLKSKRPHILLAPRQWEAIKLFHKNLPQHVDHDET